jgi:hypothetical protein
MEAWRAIPGTDGAYEVSDLGRVRSWWYDNHTSRRRRDEPLILKPGANASGYLHVNVAGLKPKGRMIHRLVLEAFVGPAPNGHECAHGDGNPANNALANLRWATRHDNQMDRRVHGTMVVGAKHHMSKLDAEKVRELRMRRASGETLKSLGERFGVSAMAVWHAAKGTTWAHVTSDPDFYEPR